MCRLPLVAGRGDVLDYFSSYAEGVQIVTESSSCYAAMKLKIGGSMLIS
jgi:hypothetical protein